MVDNQATGGAFAKYRPIAELGQGGMAQVFLALASGPVGFNKLVVIKQIREQFAEEAEFLTMFLDEARLAARLNHPNVVQTNEVGGDGQRFYICMEYLEGQPLNRILSRAASLHPGLRSAEPSSAPAPGHLTLGMQLRILVDALAGLQYAHELCDFDGRPLLVVHRDVTPHNIFLTYAGQVKLVDFGIAKALSSSAETRTGVLKGKVAYMAPEQAMADTVDRRADVYSMGMILWEMLVGRRLFKGVPDMAILQRIAAGNLPSPRALKPDVLPELEAICMKALARQPGDRYATAADMASALEGVVEARGEKGSVRDAGRLIEKLFTAEREKIRQIVESQATEGRAAADAAAFDPRTARGSLKLPILDSPTVESPTSGNDAGSIRERSSTTEAPQGSSLTVSTSSQVTGVAPPRPRDGRGLLVAAIAVATLGAALGGAFFATRGSAPAAKGAPVEAPPKVHTVLIDSTPQGAGVRENDQEIGKTPMALDLDPAATAPRRLVMSIDGYVSHTFLVTHDDTRILVPLALVPAPVPTAPVAPVAMGPQAAPNPGPAGRAPSAIPAKAEAPPPARPPARPAAPAPPPAKPAVPSDINMAR